MQTEFLQKDGKDSNDMRNMRDYDKEPIIIKDYSDLFAPIFQVCIIFLFILFYNDAKIYIGDKIYEISSVNIYTIIKATTIVVLIVAYFCWHIRKVLRRKCHFIFTNGEICYKGYDEERSRTSFKIFEAKKESAINMENISFCSMSDLHRRYGRKMKSQPKTSTIGKSLAFLYYLLLYIFSVLPYRFFVLIKNREPLSLLNKNIIIVFKNENYLLVNIYSKKNLEDLLLYFQTKNISIDYKSQFIYQVQTIDPLFPNKYEDWCDEF